MNSTIHNKYYIIPVNSRNSFVTSPPHSQTER